MLFCLTLKGFQKKTKVTNLTGDPPYPHVFGYKIYLECVTIVQLALLSYIVKALFSVFQRLKFNTRWHFRRCISMEFLLNHTFDKCEKHSARDGLSQKRK